VLTYRVLAMHQLTVKYEVWAVNLILHNYSHSFLREINTCADIKQFVYYSNLTCCKCGQMRAVNTAQIRKNTFVRNLFCDNIFHFTVIDFGETTHVNTRLRPVIFACTFLN